MRIDRVPVGGREVLLVFGSGRSGRQTSARMLDCGEVGGADGEEFAMEVGDAGIYAVGFLEKGVEGL
jgi:hypothetical protein